MPNEKHWKQKFAETALVTDLDLTLLARFVTKLEGEDREQFDRVVNRVSLNLIKMVAIIDPDLVSDPEGLLKWDEIAAATPDDELLLGDHAHLYPEGAK